MRWMLGWHHEERLHMRTQPPYLRRLMDSLGPRWSITSVSAGPIGLETRGWVAALCRLRGGQGVSDKETAGVVARDKDPGVGSCSLVSMAI